MKAGLVAAVSLTLVLFAVSCAPRPPAPGAVTDQPGANLPTVPATPRVVAPFKLTDQDGKDWSFPASDESVYLVSFLYIHCTDVCPFAALKMRLARDGLGAAAARVELVAISTDPERDTVGAVADYSQALGLGAGWHFLTGTRDRLEPVWREFGIAVSRTDAEAAIETANNAAELGLALPEGAGRQAMAETLPADERALGEQVAGRFGGGYEISHAVPFWIVDGRGRLVAMRGADATPAELTEVLRQALAGKLP